MSKSSVGNSSVGEFEVVTKGLSNINTKKTRKFLKDTERVFNNGIRDGLIDSNAGFLSFLSSYVLGNWDDFRLKYKFDSYMESILKRNKIDVRKKRRGKKVVLDLSPKFESMIRVILVEMMGVKDEHFSKFFEHIKEALFRISQAINAREKSIKKFESGGLNVRDGALEYLGKTIGYEDELNSLSSGFNWISKMFGYDSKPRSKSEIRKHPHFHIGRIGTDYAKRGVYGWFNWATGTYIPFEYTARFCLSVIVLVLYMTMGEVKIKLFKIKLDSLDYLIHEGVISGKEGDGSDLDESDLNGEIIPVNNDKVADGLGHLAKFFSEAYDSDADRYVDSDADTEIVSSSSESGTSTTDQVCSSDEDSSSFCGSEVEGLIDGLLTISGKGDGVNIPSDSKEVFDLTYDKFHKKKVTKKFTSIGQLFSFFRDYRGEAVSRFIKSLDKHLDSDKYVENMPNQLQVINDILNDSTTVYDPDLPPSEEVLEFFYNKNQELTESDSSESESSGDEGLYRSGIQKEVPVNKRKKRSNPKRKTNKHSENKHSDYTVSEKWSKFFEDENNRVPSDLELSESESSGDEGLYRSGIQQDFPGSKGQIGIRMEQLAEYIPQLNYDVLGHILDFNKVDTGDKERDKAMNDFIAHIDDLRNKSPWVIKASVILFMHYTSWNADDRYLYYNFVLTFITCNNKNNKYRFGNTDDFSVSFKSDKFDFPVDPRDDMFNKLFGYFFDRIYEITGRYCKVLTRWESDIPKDVVLDNLQIMRSCARHSNFFKRFKLLEYETLWDDDGHYIREKVKKWHNEVFKRREEVRLNLTIKEKSVLKKAMTEHAFYTAEQFDQDILDELNKSKLEEVNLNDNKLVMDVNPIDLKVYKSMLKRSYIENKPKRKQFLKWTKNANDHGELKGRGPYVYLKIELIAVPKGIVGKVYVRMMLTNKNGRFNIAVSPKGIVMTHVVYPYRNAPLTMSEYFGYVFGNFFNDLYDIAPGMIRVLARVVIKVNNKGQELDDIYYRQYISNLEKYIESTKMKGNVNVFGIGAKGYLADKEPGKFYKYVSKLFEEDLNVL